jgi:hypothetical protein
MICFQFVVCIIQPVLFAAKSIRIQPIFMSIIFHHYKQLEKIKEEIEKKGDVI